jgi:hypothetical protein
VTGETSKKDEQQQSRKRKQQLAKEKRQLEMEKKREAEKKLAAENKAMEDLEERACVECNIVKKKEISTSMRGSRGRLRFAGVATKRKKPRCENSGGSRGKKS